MNKETKHYKKVAIEDRANRRKVVAWKNILTMSESEEDSIVKLLSNYLICQMAENKSINLGGLEVNDKQ
jgi:ribosomal protein S7